MRAVVEKITVKDTWEYGLFPDPIDDEQTIYEDRSIKDAILLRHRIWGDNAKAIAGRAISLSFKIFIKRGQKEYERSYHMSFDAKERPFTHVKEDDKHRKYVEVRVERSEYDHRIAKLVHRWENSFYLSESDLIDAAAEVIGGHRKIHECRKQVQIASSVADAVCLEHNRDWQDLRLIALEAKTDADTYERLKGQILDYLSLCDEVYLVIERKEPPADLPCFVGIVKVTPDGAEIVRHASRVHRSPDAWHFWKGMLQGVAARSGVKTAGWEMVNYFQGVEDLKRKLLWVMYVMRANCYGGDGFPPLSEREKRLEHILRTTLVNMLSMKQLEKGGNYMPIIHDTGHSCVVCDAREKLTWYGELIVCRLCYAFMDEETANELDQYMLTTDAREGHLDSLWFLGSDKTGSP